MTEKKTRKKKYPFHQLAVGESFVVEWDREEVDHEPKNYHALRMAVNRANSDGTGKVFVKEPLWTGMRITRVE